MTELIAHLGTEYMNRLSINQEFYLAYPKSATLSHLLSWSRYRLLKTVEELQQEIERERAWYESMNAGVE